jgi:NADH dehydrogenase
MTPEVVIVGGGFGGLYAARALKRAPVHVTLVDRRNHHLFQPLLYQVATAALNPSDVATPIRRILRRQRNVTVVLGEVQSIDRVERRLLLADGELRYDFLILASGSTHSYFGHDEWGAFAHALKSVEDATAVRSRILIAFEAAEREPDEVARRAWMTFVVVGGGPTGVEMAGAMAEISRGVLTHDFRNIRPSGARIVIVEAGPRLLASMPADLSGYAQRDLERLGVEIHSGVPVEEVDGSGVRFGGQRIDARTVIWAAGVRASTLGRTLGLPPDLYDRVGRVRVSPDLTAPGTPEVFVIGDLAHLEEDGHLLPGLAPVAIQEGEHTARNIERALVGAPYEPFHYHDKGTLAIIGRRRAIGDIHGHHIHGFFAFLVWAVVHILWLIGFRNRFFVMSEWAWTYLRSDRGARLITHAVGPLLVPPPRPVIVTPRPSPLEAHPPVS